jgi:hypothetical protein
MIGPARLITPGLPVGKFNKRSCGTIAHPLFMPLFPCGSSRFLALSSLAELACFVASRFLLSAFRFVARFAANSYRLEQ